MQRRTSEQTKALLIETGMELLLERGPSGAVSHVRLQQVLKRAGLTTGAAYRLWSDQDAYQHDLAVYAARWRDDEPTARIVARIGPLLERGAPFREVVRQATAVHVEGFERVSDGPGQPVFLTALALRATSLHSEELRQASRERHEESVAAFSALYRQLSDHYHLPLRPGRTIEEFSEAMAAIGEGYALQAIQGVIHRPIAVHDGSGSGDEVEWTLYGLTVWALIESFIDVGSVT